MDLGSFLGQVRAHYVAQFAAFVAEQQQGFARGAAEVKLQMQPESALFGKLYCVDFIGDTGAGHSVQELVPEDVLEFDRVSVPLGLSYVSIESMSWDDVVINHDLEIVPEDALGDWFAQWFDPEDARHVLGVGVSEVVHSLLVEPGTLSIDLGTAPPEAMLAMLEMLVAAGARTLRVTGSRGD
nr:hypothetical protein [Polymorphobacter sp.]